MKDKTLFDAKRKLLVKKYHVIEINTEQVMASYNANIESSYTQTGRGIFFFFFLRRVNILGVS
jgi:hypothetical protein